MSTPPTIGPPWRATRSPPLLPGDPALLKNPALDPAKALLPGTDALAELAGVLVRQVLPTDLQSNDESRLNEQLAGIAETVDNEDYWGAAEQGLVGMLDTAS